MIGLLAGCGVTSPGSILHPAKARQRDPIRGPLRRLQTSRAALSQTRAGLGYSGPSLTGRSFRAVHHSSIPTLPIDVLPDELNGHNRATAS
jgi:hypothetical protein